MSAGGNYNGSEAYRDPSKGGPRHGSFVRISEAELSVLKRAYPNRTAPLPPRPGYVC